MQSTGSAPHDAAIIAPSRSIGSVVQIDWPHGGTDGDYASVIADVSLAVAGWELDRSLATTLPSEVRLAEGVATAELTLTLGGEETPALVGTDNVARSVIALLSPYNTASELYRQQLVGRLIKVRVGAQSFNTLPQFVGRIRSIEPQPSNGTVKITALDFSESLRIPADLPVVVASAEASSFRDIRKPGLNASWVINYLARQAGFYTSPKRSSVLLEASMNGSAWPELCTDVFSLVNTAGWNVADTLPVEFVNGVHPHGQAAKLTNGLAADSKGRITVLSYEIAAQPYASGSIHIEAWCTQAVGSVGGGWSIRLTGNPTGASTDGAPPLSFPFLFLFCDGGTTVKGAYYKNYGTGVAAGSSVLATWPNDGLPHYFGARCAFSASGVTITARVDGTTSSPVNLFPGAATAPTSTSFHEVQVTGTTRGNASSISDLCVTSETAAVTWNNTFVPTAVIDRSELDLTTIPPVKGQDAYDTMQDIAGAEAAASAFDESGIYTYRTRSRFESATGYTSVRTLDADSALVDLAMTTAIDTVRNDVRVPVQPYVVSLYKAIWEASEAIVLPAGLAVTVVADLDSPVFDVDETLTYGYVSYLVPSAGPGNSGYYGNTKPDGTGRALGQVVASMVITSDGIKLTMRNKHRITLYLVQPELQVDADGNNIAGQPSLFIGGRAADAGQPTKVQRADEGAALKQIYEAPDSVWRQSTAVATTLAIDLLSDLESPRPQFVDVPIVGDYRLQLGDVVTLSDPYRLRLSQEARILGIRTSVSPGDFSQTLDVRALYPPSVLILDRVGQNTLNSTWVLA